MKQNTTRKESSECSQEELEGIRKDMLEYALKIGLDYPTAKDTADIAIRAITDPSED